MPTPRKTTDEPMRTTEEGREILVYESGAKKDAATGKWLNGPTTPELNPVLADPAGMQKRGQELIRQRAIQEARDALDSAAISKGRIDESLRGTGYGWFAAIEKAGELYFESKSARGAEGLLTVLGRATGNLSSRDEVVYIPPGN